MNDLELHVIQEILSDISCDKLKGSQCLIVGATGALGRYIVYSLMELYKWTNDKNAKVAVLSRSREKAEEYFSEYMAEPQFSIIEGTVETTVLDNYTFDYIIHAGCISATLNFTSNPVEIISANIIGLYNLLEFARKNGTKGGVLFLSSCAVNGKGLTDYYSYTGIDPMVVQNCYALSKKQGENLCAAYYDEYRVPAKIIRVGYSYGPYVDLHDGHLYSDFLRAIVEKKDLVIHGDGERHMGFCYVTDTVRGILKVLLDGKPSTPYVVRNQIEIKKIKEIAQELTEEVFAERGLNYICQEQKVKGDAATNYEPVMPQLLMEMGWEPRITLAEGFRRSVEIIERRKLEKVTEEMSQEIEEYAGCLQVKNLEKSAN